MTPCPPDTELWKDFRNGSEAAFARIYETYFKRLYNYGFQFCRDGELIKDCLQNLFIDLRRSRSNLGDVYSLRHYLYAALRRKLIREMGAARHQSVHLPDDYAFQIVIPHEDHLIAGQLSRDQRDMLERALQHLTKRQREVIFLKFYENMSYEEVASVMQLDDVKSARNLVYKALRSLRELIPNPALLVLLLLVVGGQ